MLETEIEKVVTKQIINARQNLKSEHPKFDFKAKWYPLTKKNKGYFEFLKDISSIANTIGLDGFLVIGYDEKSDEFIDSPISESGIDDSLKILQLVGRNLSDIIDLRFFEFPFEGHTLSVIHIPPSLNKPFVIGEYKRWNKKGILIREQNKIFVRKDSGTFPASKYDIDLMYYDRKNIIPDYKLNISTPKINVGGYPSANRFAEKRFRSSVELDFAIENVGRRPISINHLRIKILNNYNTTFELYGKSTLNMHYSKIDPQFLIIKPGDIKFFSKCNFLNELEYKKGVLNFQYTDKTKFEMDVILTNKKVICCLIER